jgi:hypothetical protein
MSSHRQLALAGLALALAVAGPVPMAFAQDVDPPSDQAGALDAPPDDEAPAIPPAPQGRAPSGIEARLADWIAITDDNGALPYLIVDKLKARIFAFDPVGQFLGSAPVLVGLAPGDDSAPGIGDHKLSEISADQRTTPAGRFVAGFGESNGHGQVLWVDFQDAISLHPVMSVSPGEHRLQRIKSSDPDQHRISYGCINVPATYYDHVVLTALAGGKAVVYVLPDTKPLSEVFPAFAAASGDEQGSVPPARLVSTDDLLSGGLDRMPDPAEDGSSTTQAP